MDDNAFESTRWSVIDEASHPDERVRQAALERLTQAYYGPMSAYLQRLMPEDNAEDCLHDFMRTKFLNGLFDRQWDRQQRFRTFLKVCLKNHVRDYYRQRGAAYNRPNQGATLPEEVHENSSPDAFDLDWARTVLQESILTMYQQCLQADQAARWEIFVARSLRPNLERQPPEPYVHLLRRLNLDSQRQADTMLVAGKRHFSRTLTDTLTKYATNKHQVQDEVRDLRRILSQAASLELRIPGAGGDSAIDSALLSARALLDDNKEEILAVFAAAEREQWESLLNSRLVSWVANPDFRKGLGQWGTVTFASLLATPQVPREVAVILKNSARKLIEDGPAACAPRVATLAYHVSIALAMAQHGQRISTLEPDRLRAVFLHQLEQTWFGDAPRTVFIQALERMQASMR